MNTHYYLTRLDAVEELIRGGPMMHVNTTEMESTNHKQRLQDDGEGEMLLARHNLRSEIQCSTIQLITCHGVNMVK